MLILQMNKGKEKVVKWKILKKCSRKSHVDIINEEMKGSSSEEE